jgi:hypothetical protein
MKEYIEIPAVEAALAAMQNEKLLPVKHFSVGKRMPPKKWKKTKARRKMQKQSRNNNN